MNNIKINNTIARIVKDLDLFDFQSERDKHNVLINKIMNKLFINKNEAENLHNKYLFNTGKTKSIIYKIINEVELFDFQNELDKHNALINRIMNKLFVNKNEAENLLIINMNNVPVKQPKMEYKKRIKSFFGL